MSRRRKNLSALSDQEIRAIVLLIAVFLLLIISLWYLVWGIRYLDSGYIFTAAVGLVGSWVAFRCYRNERKEMGE